MHWCQKWSGLLTSRTIPYRPTELILSHLRAGSPGVNPGSCCTYGTGVTASDWFKIYRKWRPFRALCCSGMLVTPLLTHPSCLTASVLSLRLWCRKILRNLILTWFQSPPLPHHLLWVGLNPSRLARLQIRTRLPAVIYFIVARGITSWYLGAQHIGD